jgi:hypothetical protein
MNIYFENFKMYLVQIEDQNRNHELQQHDVILVVIFQEEKPHLNKSEQDFDYEQVVIPSN